MMPLSTALMVLLTEVDPPTGEAPTEASWTMISFFTFFAIGIIVLALGLRWQLKRTRKNAAEGLFSNPANPTQQPSEEEPPPSDTE